MKAYRVGVNLKLGLIVAAVLIAVASLWYTNRLANRLQQDAEDSIELYARGVKHSLETQFEGINPYPDEWRELLDVLTVRSVREALRETGGVDDATLERWRQALLWARSMPPTGETDFVNNEIIYPRRFSVPAILTDLEMEEVSAYNNIEIPRLPSQADTTAFLLAAAREMDRAVEPYVVDIEYQGEVILTQLVHYGESQAIRQLRRLPYLQLFFVGLFILVGYLGFSYVRRSEQNSLWVGMAKEAAHQLGTPISSMMGWVELLRESDDPTSRQTADELDNDIRRLQRVANRFSKIGSRPNLVPTDLGAVVGSVADYMRRRLPRHGRGVDLVVDIPEGLTVPLNAELFEWVIENLIKNALDAIEHAPGRITLSARILADQVQLDISDTGKGIDKRQSKNIFRPGYSTKKRGWGLGLSLAKRIVESYHGGSLELAGSRPGEGSTFRITLKRTG